VAKQKEQQSVIITPKQRRAIDALRFERDEIVRRANEHIAEIEAAFQEQGRMLAMLHGLPHGEGFTYRFEGEEVDGETQVKLVAVPSEPEEETEEEADDGE
jgi:hypothetical protein